MDIKEHVKQYTNRELCAKWSNNIPASELDQNEYSWIHGYQLNCESQDLDAICDSFPFLPRGDITGIICKVGDGDYSEVYITEYIRPYMHNAIYHPLEYYL